MKLLIYQGLITIYLGVYLTAFSAVGAIPKIKVRVAKHLSRVSISGKNITNKIEVNTSKKTYRGKKTLRFECARLSQSVKNDHKAVKLASLKSSYPLRWKDGGFFGTLKVVLPKKSRGCDLINELSMEKYISLLLSKEMNSRWPIEALKAQAVAARSYAYHKKTSKQVAKNLGHDPHYDLENSEKHQVNGYLEDINSRTLRAARETQGQILTLKGGKSTPIFFHSKCGGHTLSPEKVWQNKVAGYQGVTCPYCHRHGNKDWRVDINKGQILPLINETLKDQYQSQLLDKNKYVKIIPDHRRNSSIRLYDGPDLKVLKKSKIRLNLGPKKVRSNNFKLDKDEKGLFLVGSGYGHGVGMCQFGALEMAKRGYSYKQILRHYFPNHRLRGIY